MIARSAEAKRLGIKMGMPWFQLRQIQLPEKLHIFSSNVASEKLMNPTRDTRDIIAAAVKSLDRIWLDGYRYAKAGVMLNDFTPTGVSQLNLFDEIQPRAHSEQLMKALDSINHSGLGKVWFAGRGIAPEWQMKREMLSPAYTTRWSEIPVATIR